ncbi:hypothetical protein F4679DRAFT_533819 [Xylaria curta]|nr:hypothetical protein F4679DRAFT_533819 [Xylaria curta]
MSSISFESQVYTGLWRDWSRGSVLGHILTLSRFDGNLVIAFTAFFVAFVATRFWLILSLLSHRHYSSVAPRHTLYHQQQAILRNSPTPEAAFLSLLQLWWAWRSLGFRRRIKVLSVSVLAAFTVVVFTVAGGLSANISSSVGDKVLVKSSNCGILIREITPIALYDKFYAELTSNTANYAQQCYSAARSGLLNCNRFIKDHLPSTVNYNASCPFSSSICRSNTSNIRLDSGPININNDLGLNGNETRKISFRHVLTCAPLVTKGYTSQVNTSNGGLVRYHYGQREAIQYKSDSWQDFVYQSSSLASQYPHNITERYGDRFNSRFQLSTVYQYTDNRQPGQNDNEYKFISDLFRSDGDLSIIFLEGNGVMFDQRMDDDWYRAIIPRKNLLANSTDNTRLFYTPDEAASPLGCLEQYQLCYAERCGPLASLYDAIVESAPSFDLTAAEIQSDQYPTGNLPAMNFIWLTNILSSIYLEASLVVDKLGPSSLSSQSLFAAGIQFVASQQDQWKQDTENWFNITLALLQSTFLNVVLRSADPELEQSISPPMTDFDKAMCNSQTIRSTSYTSFSVFGLLFTYIFGGLIIIVSAVIDPVLSFLRHRYNYQTYEQLEWETNHYLQLHRLAQEELGYGEWTKCTKTIPITGDGEVLGSLDIQDLDHPVIAHRHKEPEKNDNSESINPSTANTATEESLTSESDSGESQLRNEDDTASQVQHLDDDTIPQIQYRDEYGTISVDEARHMLATASTQEESGGLDLTENEGVVAASKAK